MRLPHLIAVEFRTELKTGTTRPCVFLCEDAAGEAGEYVTKMRGDVRGTSGLCFEYVAACLARRFGIVRLTDTKIEEIFRGVPAVFGRQHIQAIANHLRSVRGDAESFLRAVQEVVR